MKQIEALNKLFNQLKIKVDVKSCIKENSFLIFDLALNYGGTFRKLETYSTEIALALKSLSPPLIYPILEKGIIRMEVMVEKQDTVYLTNIIQETDGHLPLILGLSRKGKLITIDLTKAPHILLAGTTGSGKSIMLHTIIYNLLNQNVNLALIDTKRVEFSCYNNLSKLFAPIAIDVDGAINLLKNLIIEMEERFLRLEKSRCRDIFSYKGDMPFVVLIIDEFADLMVSNKKEVQKLICKLAQKSRACGIFEVMATQRPSADVITGLIKANFPTRIAFKVNSGVDSRIILNQQGAEKLTGNGDGIIQSPEYDFQRFKGCYLSEEDIQEVINKNRKSWWNRIFK